MRPELRQKIMMKFASQIESLMLSLGGGPKPKGWALKGLQNSGFVGVMESKLRRIPDKHFEVEMKKLDALEPELVIKGLKAMMGNAPKNRGGRPASFPLDIRRRAVQDVGHEYPQCDSLADAIDIVAARYGMRAEYLRKVWKNRKRLRQRDTETGELAKKQKPQN